MQLPKDGASDDHEDVIEDGDGDDEQPPVVDVSRRVDDQHSPQTVLIIINIMIGRHGA